MSAAPQKCFIEIQYRYIMIKIRREIHLEIQLETPLEMYIGSCRRCQQLPSSASSQPRSSGYDSAAFRYPPTSISHHHGYDEDDDKKCQPKQQELNPNKNTNQITKVANFDKYQTNIYYPFLS